MPSGYRLGVLTVLAAIFVSGGLTLAMVRGGAESSAPAPAGQDLEAADKRIGAFSLVERSGERVTDATLADRVWIASFIFTRCKLSCPRITSVMKGLQARLADAGADVTLVSISVDPDYDTPEVLSEYAGTFGADPERWLFLTGPRDETLDLIQKKFLLTAMRNPSPAADGSDEEVIHSDRLVLVDRDRLVGIYDSNDPKALDALIRKAKRLGLPSWVRAMPPINASLNGLSGLLVLLGWSSIRRRSGAAELAMATGAAEAATGVRARLRALRVSPAARGHALAMGAAVLVSTAFIGCYLTYHALAGSTRFPGAGFSKWLYLTILPSHSVLAALAALPLVIVSLLRALRGDFEAHLRSARVALPIWLYVSVTGVVIYWMLYQLPAAG